MNKIDLLEPIRKRQAARQEKQKELRITFGEQDPIDPPCQSYTAKLPSLNLPSVP